ncbi:hypothetical protein C1N91_12670 [Curtobacterium sp. SGAir0471]|uniref:NAD-dependent epimerase/dehydratase family protein n=1 Tax=Curtobacterium sp. SGAir0471 TaxID=2070337 RepID=UPI0010CCB962|nr:NAD-dependent epimerase/dehydratase family protein [Curtobacterium sp. SGAir0471]QCR44247.1 hypothetical protein C1N91_12670 [Curtobacterium sp. SGAir0471]
MTVLIIGGGGYIGSHIASELRRCGQDTLVADNWASGVRRLGNTVRAATVDITAPGASHQLAALMRTERVRVVFHLAALKSVEESVRDPRRYIEVNVAGTAAVLNAMSNAAVRKLVFASSAAVYAPIATGRVTIASPIGPVNPYGVSKLEAEGLIRTYTGRGIIDAVVLRFFNVAGCESPSLADLEGVSVMSQFCRAAANEGPLVVRGTDYRTADGSAVRDYIDVRDIADLHRRLAEDRAWPPGIRYSNVGRGLSVSVLELAQRVQALAPSKPPIISSANRAGDIEQMVSSREETQICEGWQPRYGLDDMIRATLEAQLVYASDGATPVPARTPEH